MEDDPSPGGDPSRFTYWMFDLEAVLICLTINKNVSISYYTLSCQQQVWSLGQKRRGAINLNVITLN